MTKIVKLELLFYYKASSLFSSSNTAIKRSSKLQVLNISASISFHPQKHFYFLEQVASGADVHVYSKESSGLMVISAGNFCEIKKLHYKCCYNGKDVLSESFNKVDFASLLSTEVDKKLY